jgi:hypothetical protein
VRAELRSLDSADAPEGLESFRPGEPGADLFYFHVCSPRWIETNPPPKGFEFMHGFLVLTRWDHKVVVRAIKDLCLRTEGADWQEVAMKLSRYGNWEFADYRE